MARTTATISVGGDTSQLERQIQVALSKDFKLKGLDSRSFTQPLGRITGASGEFQKSLDASNARVIAFGASAGIIYQVQRAFSELIKSTVEVEKQLADINVILNASSQNLAKFGSSLFDIAKSTGQSFSAAAGAATELARQGLGVEETLKRTKDALILTRLSGLDTVSAVESLTATINSFNETALDSTIIINKLANVDAAFAVSSADLAEAIKRVGSSAQDVGVDFDELLAIVTSVQQTTARGGAVIGNSLKTIFTRIQRTDTLDQLESLGVQVRSLEGNTLPALQVLQNLAGTFDTLGDSQRAQIAETVGGVFQINVLKAALGDLSKEYSVYKNALDISRSSADEAILRNEKLNETLSALINQTAVNLTKIGADVGSISFAPTIKNVLELLNKGLESFSTQGDGFGNKLAKGILEGLGSFIGGPGLVLISAVFFKLFANLSKFAAESLKSLLNINTQAQQRAIIEQKISTILAQEPALLNSIVNKQVSLLSLENKILETIKAQTIARQQAASISSAITTNLLGRGVGTTKTGVIRTKSSGHIPGASEETLGALAGGYTPGRIKRMNMPGEGMVTYNGAEEVKKFPGFSQPAIIPPKDSISGKEYRNNFISRNGFDPYASGGYVPNFSLYDTLLSQVRNRSRGVDQKINAAINNNQLTPSQIDSLRKENTSVRSVVAPSLVKNKSRETRTYNAENLGVLALRGGGAPTSSTSIAQLPIFSNLVKSNPDIGNKIIEFQNIQVRSLEQLGAKKPAEFINILNEEMLPSLAKVAQRFLGTALGDEADSVSQVLGSLKSGKSFIPPGAIGDLFEAAIKIATKNPKEFVASVDDDFRRPFDFEEGGPASGKFKSTFGFTPSLLRADAKLTAEPRSIRSIIGKAYNAGLPNLPYKELLTSAGGKKKSSGYIPNFAELSNPALEESIKRELSAGIPPSAIKIGSDYRLSAKNNPLGLGVYNTINEPMGLNQGISKYATLSEARVAGNTKSGGYIPNFQDIYLPPSSQFAMEKQAAQGQIQAAQTWSYINASTKAYANTLSRLTSTTETANKQIGKFGGFGSGLAGAASIGVPLILSTLQQYVPENSKIGPVNTRGGLGVLSSTAAFAGTGALIGSAFPGAGTAIGAGIGAATGLGIGVYQYIKALNDIDFSKLSGELELLRERNNNSANALGGLLPLVSQYQEIMSSSLSQPVKEANLNLIGDKINEVLEIVPEGLRDNILNAISQGKYQEVGGLIAQSIAQGAREISIKEAVTFFEGVKKSGGAIETKESAIQAGRALLNVRSESGERVISAKVKTEEGKKQISDIIKRIEGISDSINPEDFTVLNAAVKNTGIKTDALGNITSESVDVLDFANQQFAKAGEAGDVLGFSARAMGVDLDNSSSSIKDQSQELIDSMKAGKPSNFEESPNSGRKDLGKKYDKIDVTLNSIIQELKPLYEDTAESREAFDQVAEDAREIALKGGTVSEIKKYIIRTLRNTLKAEENYKKITEENVTNASQFARAFKNRILTEGKINKYLNILNTSEEYDPALTTGRAQAEQYELVRKEITNQKIRDAIDQDIIKKQMELTGMLDKKQITEDQYINAVRGYTQSVILAQKRANGLIFAEDYRSGRQQARESRTLGNQASPLDVFESFGDEMSYKTEDLYRTMQLGAADTARTIKDQFGNAFQSLIDGTQSAEDAFRNMAINIAQRIQQLALDAAINSALGGVFGVLGFNKGGFVNNFSKVTKRRDGGIIKKFASGGPVQGGSGLRDDVPSMLSAGEYVIKKSAVKKYGSDFLTRLNASSVPKAEEGLFLTPAELFTQTSRYRRAIKAGLPLETFGLREYDPKASLGEETQIPEGDGPTGGGFQYRARNVFRYNDPFEPTDGGREYSEVLSTLALEDANNPQNALIKQRGETLVKYIADQINYQEELAIAKADFEEEEAKRRRENEQINSTIRSNFEAQRRNQLFGGVIQSGGILGAGALSTYGVPALKNLLSPTGGNMFSAGNPFGSKRVRPGEPVSPRDTFNPSARRLPVGRAMGSPKGGETDNIPALLTGGEYVVNRDTVRLYGKRFFDDINSKKIGKFAEGGLVGESNYGLSSNATDRTKPTEAINNQSSVLNNVININVNVDAGGMVSQAPQTQQTVSTNGKTSMNIEAAIQESKSLGERIKTEVVKVIGQQQRPGGLFRK